MLCDEDVCALKYLGVVFARRIRYWNFRLTIKLNLNWYPLAVGGLLFPFPVVCLLAHLVLKRVNQENCVLLDLGLVQAS